MPDSYEPMKVSKTGNYENPARVFKVRRVHKVTCLILQVFVIKSVLSLKPSTVESELHSKIG